MSRAKRAANRVLKPGLPWLLGLTLFCAPALWYVFFSGREHSMIAYCVYVASAYTLIMMTIGLVGAGKRIKNAVYAHAVGRRYLTDLPFRGRVSLYGTTTINVCYAMYELFCALCYRSVWFGTLGVYYFILAVARAVLLRSVRPKTVDRRRELYAARLCGWLLLAINAALSLVAAQMVIDGMGYAYPGSMIFVMAFYTFYSIINSIINLVRFRKLCSPALSASKVLGVAAALVSLLSLQTAMFASFGGAYAYQRLMNALTGGAVCALIFFMAARMLFRVRAKLVLPESHNL